MEKLLTISVAAYNVENYIANTIESLIIDNMDLLEVLIIIDGSKDNTIEIAKKYEKRYPNTFKVIYKENGGYGSTINTAIRLATGKYFKQLDGDDWYNTENLNQLCLELKKTDTDIVYTPYIKYFERNDEYNIIKHTIVDSKEITDLEEVLRGVEKENIGMHALMYKTELLRKNKIHIDENCFYTDTEYAIFPTIYAKTIKIFDIPLYVYRIGIKGQSMSIKNRIKYYKNCIIVNYNLLEKLKNIDDNELNKKKYMEGYISRLIARSIYDFLLLLPPKKENYLFIKEYLRKVQHDNTKIYNKVSNQTKLLKLICNNGFIIYILCCFIRKANLILKKR